MTTCTVGYPIWSPSPKVEVLTYSDASGEGWGGFAVQFSDKVARGCWSCADCLKSSTFREVKAIILPALDIFRPVVGPSHSGSFCKLAD